MTDTCLNHQTYDTLLDRVVGMCAAKGVDYIKDKNLSLKYISRTTEPSRDANGVITAGQILYYPADRKTQAFDDYLYEQFKLHISMDALKGLDKNQQNALFDRVFNAVLEIAQREPGAELTVRPGKAFSDNFPIIRYVVNEIVWNLVGEEPLQPGKSRTVINFTLAPK